MIMVFVVGLLGVVYAFSFMLHCIKRNRAHVPWAVLLWSAPLALLVLLAISEHSG